MRYQFHLCFSSSSKRYH